jgi:hypothetical protein
MNKSRIGIGVIIALCQVAFSSIENNIPTLKYFDPGIQLGLGYDWLDYDGSISPWKPSPWIGYSIAGVLTINTSDLFQVETGIRFCKTGNKYRNKLNSMDSLRSYDATSYDEIYSLSTPLKLLVPVGLANIKIIAGADIAYLTGFVNIIDIDDPKYRDQTVSELDGVNRINSDAVFGISSFTTVYGKKVSVYLEYYHGLKSLSKGENWITGFYTREILFSCLISY